MSERYTRLFSLQENLYSEGAPIIIVAGAIQKDNKTGRVIGQLKFVSIADTDIKAVTVKISPYDTVGRTLGEPIIFNYLDLDVHRDDTFGDKTAIPFANEATRSYSVEVIEVVFADKSIWSGGDSGWTPLPALVSLSDAMQDSELAKQYCVEFGNDCKYWPQENGNLWYCTCGGINFAREARCHLCERDLSELKHINIDGLLERRNIRLANERKQHKIEETAAKEKARKSKVLISALVSLALLAVAIMIVAIKVIIPSTKYNKAIELFNNGQYTDAIASFGALGDYRDSSSYVYEAKYALADNLIGTNPGEAAIAFGSLSDYADSRMRSLELWNTIAPRNTVFATSDHTFGLKSNGTVISAGSVAGFLPFLGNDQGQLDVSGWSDVISVSAGSSHTLGLKADGTVYAIGENDDGQCDVSTWKDIVSISAGAFHSVGVRIDGTVVAVGSNAENQCDVTNWKGIVAVAAGSRHTVGLTCRGTVIATGDNSFGQCDVDSWTDIVAISTSIYQTLGLRKDGTVVAAGDNVAGSCDVSSWKGITAISAGAYHSVGLLEDGTVIATNYSGTNYSGECDVSSWDNIVALSAGEEYTVGLKKNGTAVATGKNYDGQCDVTDWTDIKIP